jgi:ABC-type lipoprotein export system ATPase subunit
VEDAVTTALRGAAFEVEGLTVEFAGGVRPLDEVTATIGPEPVAVMGPSGSGKTTLLNVLSGRQRYAGHVLLDGTLVRDGDRRVAVVHQDYRLVEFLTVVENVQLGAEARGSRLSAVDARALLDTVGLGHLPPDRRPGACSGGEQQRVAIARALATDCAALVADEPTGALDRDNTDLVADTLLRVAVEREILLLVATHDHTVAARFPTTLLVEAGGLRSLAAEVG